VVGIEGAGRRVAHETRLPSRRRSVWSTAVAVNHPSFVWHGDSIK
jgi:hypothetical protein